MRTKTIITVATLALLSRGGPSAFAGGATAITELPALPGAANVFPRDVNADGLVVGTSGNRAAVWVGGTATELPDNGATISGANAVNDLGEVVGFAQIPSGVFHAMRWALDVNRQWVMTDLGALSVDPNSKSSFAYGIDNTGRVVGWSDTDVNSPYFGAPWSFIWSEGNGMTDLTGLGQFDFTEAYDINASSQVVGSVGCIVVICGAYLWENGQSTSLNLTTPNAINDAGQVAGKLQFCSKNPPGCPAPAAILWESGQAQNIGVLPGRDAAVANDINNRRQIVGMSQTWQCTNCSPDDIAAFLWTNDVMTNLNDLLPVGSGWQLTDAVAINDAGVIVGRGVNPASTSSAFVLSPASSPADIAGPLGPDFPDGCVDAIDLAVLLNAWCSAAGDPDPPGDVDPPCEGCVSPNFTLADMSGLANVPDGCVDAFDLAKLLAEWCSVAGGNPCGTCFP